MSKQSEIRNPKSETIGVGFVTDRGSIDDGTYNQYAYEGLKRSVEELAIKLDIIESESPVEFEANIRRLIERGCNFIVTAGAMLGTAVERLAVRHPAVHFIIVDHEPLPESGNVTGLLFAEDQAGFLAGALAGLVTERGTVGFVGGMECAPVAKFQRGFEHGVAFTNRRANVVQTYTDSFTDREAGETAAGELVGQGADVVFAAGGESGSAAIRAAAQQGVWAIGVDQDEWVTTFQGGAVPGAERLLTSAVKRIDQAVYSALVLAVRGKLQSGVLRYDLANDGVGLASYHMADTAVPSEVRGKTLEVAEELRTGRVRTRVGPEGEELVEGLLPRLMARNWQPALMPILAIFTALVIGALIIAVSSPDVLAAWGQVFRNPLGALSTTWVTSRDAYVALFEGSFGSPARIIQAIDTLTETGESRELLEALRPFSESLVISAPYIFAGLAVTLSFRGGLFNIGAEGQLFVGGLASAYVGYSISGLAWYVHLPLTLLAGTLAGAIWGAIPGFLKARTGAHEVITTIMMNYVAFRLTDHLLQGPMARPDGLPITPEVLPSAYLPALFPRPVRLHAGFFLALAAAALVYWFLWKTTRGFEIRTVGANPRAARYAGIRITSMMVLTMALSGALAGLAGSNQVLGLDHKMVRAVSAGYGFDSIALALLGNSHPVGVVLSSLLFGFLRGGGARMQSVAGVPVEIIRVVQGMVIIFVAAPEIIRGIYRLRVAREEGPLLVRGWGS